MARLRDLAPSEVDSSRPRPEAVAAIVNALLVLLVPVGWSVAAWLTIDSSGRARARVSPNLEHTVATLGLMAAVIAPFVPLAMISGWRTWVHAQRYCAQQGRGWQGVAEAGVLGFIVAIVVLARGILTRPADALAVCGGLWRRGRDRRTRHRVHLATVGAVGATCHCQEADLPCRWLRPRPGIRPLAARSNGGPAPTIARTGVRYSRETPLAAGRIE